MPHDEESVDKCHLSIEHSFFSPDSLQNLELTKVFIIIHVQHVNIPDTDSSRGTGLGRSWSASSGREGISDTMSSMRKIVSGTASSGGTMSSGGGDVSGATSSGGTASSGGGGVPEAVISRDSIMCVNIWMLHFYKELPCERFSSQILGTL